MEDIPSQQNSKSGKSLLIEMDRKNVLSKSKVSAQHKSLCFIKFKIELKVFIYIKMSQIRNYLKVHSKTFKIMYNTS